MSGLRLAVFDMIGTTVDADEAVRTSLCEAFAPYGVKLSDGAVAAARGRSKTEAIAELVTAYLPEEREPERLTREIDAAFRDLLRSSLETRARAMPGTDEVFRWLGDRHVAVVLTTGLDRETAAGLVRRLGWHDAGLGGVVTGDDVTQGRPAPELIRGAMRLADVGDPVDVLNVGDTAADLASAHAAGVGWSVGVLSGAHSSDQLRSEPHSALLGGVADLPEWLSTVGAFG